jgi:tetratricopeptide (TPR) repeat protein
MLKNLLILILNLLLSYSYLVGQSTQISLQKSDSLGQYHWRNAAYGQALYYYKKALPLAQELKEQKWQARILNYLGIIYENIGDFELSLVHHLKALKLREALGDKAEIAKSYVNLGITYASSGQDKKGLEYYFKTLAICKQLKIKEERLETHTLYHISTSYRRLKKYTEAIQFATQALQKAESIAENVIIIDAQNGLGLIATEQKQYEKGRSYYQKVYDLAEKTQDWLILTNTLQHFAENYEQSFEYVQAIEFAQKSLKLAQKHGLKVEEKNAYFILATLHNKQNKFKEAFDYQLQYNILKDTLFNLQKSQQIAELTIQYETEKKEQQIQLLEKDKKLHQNTIYGLILLSLLLLVLIFWAFYRYWVQRKLADQQKNILQTELALQETQRKMEKARLEDLVAHKTRELTSKMMHIFQKNEMINTLQEKLNELKPETRSELKPLFQDLKNNLDLGKDWENFQRHFVEVHPRFFATLLDRFPSLSLNEQKLLAYIRLKMSNKEIADLMNTSTKSVEMARYRLKKKFNLSHEDSLDRWLERI